MNLFIYVIFGLLLLAVSSSSVSAQELKESLSRLSSTHRPNIVVILADDLGYGEVPGLDIPTPNIDRIAQEGVRFTQAYVTHPTCVPSRAGLLLGQNQHRFGLESNPGRTGFGIEPSVVTLAERLGGYGYTTGLIGKWHLGFDAGQQPLDHGFDEFFGFFGGSARYFPVKPSPRNPTRNPTGNYPTIYRNGEPVPVRMYSTDAFGQEAVDFIRRHKEEPFFLYLSFNAVHTPLEAKEEDMKKYEHIQDETRRVYAGMTEAMDRAVGNVLDTLQKLDLEEETLVIFTSDNGGQTRKSTSSNKPLRGLKGELYEGGIRVPFSIRWKNHISPGTTYEHAISTLDIYPTAVGAAGEEVGPEWGLDGVNLLPYLKGDNQAMPHETLYWRGGDGAWFAILQEGRWKLVLMRDTPELHRRKWRNWRRCLMSGVARWDLLVGKGRFLKTTRDF